MSRLDAVRNRAFDVVVIGGGIIGAGIARDASLRGLSVALFEQRDFASGTTAGSTRLIHGGLRYLEMLDFALVRMDLRERETLLRIAPHLVKPLEFLIPFYDRTLFDRVKLRAGMVLYGALSYDKSLPGYRTWDAEEVMQAEPALRREGLQGAVSYFDAQVESPERLTIENIVDANQHGAVTLNYVPVTGALRGDRGITGVRVRDAGGSEADVAARVVVNASGPWFDRVADRVELGARPRIRTTKGIHLVCPRLTNRAVVLFSGLDDRLFFVIPLMGFGWVGTTDTDFTDDPSNAAAESGDVEYLIQSAGAFLPGINGAPVWWTNAGIRALVMQEGKESDVSRSHRIESADGIVSVLGGKITGYRYIAEEAVDAVCAQLRCPASCTTDEQLLPGARTPPSSNELADTVRRAVEMEHCFHLDDFMLRRSTLGLAADQGLALVPTVAALMSEALGWENARKQAEIERFAKVIEKTRQHARPASVAISE